MSLSAPSQVRVATLNTWGTRGDWDDRRPVLRDGLAALDADLITLQETIVTGDYDQAADVLAKDYQLVHQQGREEDGQGITTASRWPLGRTIELDLNVTARTGDFACTSLITEVLAPDPLGRIWLVNHFPDYQMDHEHERELQAIRAAQAVEDRLPGRPGHVVVARRPRRRPGRHQHPVLDRAARARRSQRLLPGRLGVGPAWRARPHLRAR